MIVRLHYADGKTEDHELKNGVHFADYIRRVDVPGSKFAFAPARPADPLPGGRAEADRRDRSIELVKGADTTAPDRHGGDGGNAVGGANPPTVNRQE